MSEDKEPWFNKLIPFGFAPGNYECKCARCERAFLGDKRATGCVSCATIAQQAKEIDEARQEAEYLAKALYNRYYKEESPNFELCSSVAGVITQIDNMVAGLGMEIDELKATVNKLRVCQPCKCGDVGYFVIPNVYTGEPEQEQCEFCYTEPNSRYNAREATPEQSLAAHDLIKRGEVIKEIMEPLDEFLHDGKLQTFEDRERFRKAVRNLKTTQD